MVETNDEWVDWIDAKNKIQVEWALQYLRDTVRVKLADGIESFPACHALQSAAQAISQRPDIGSSWKALERMKNAWRKQKQRLKAQKQGKKQVTLSISATALRQLNRLVSQSETKTSASKIVEKLITKEAISRKAESEAEQRDRQKNEVGRLVFEQLDGQAPRVAQPPYRPTMRNIPTAGRYFDDAFSSEAPQQPEVHMSNTRLAQASQPPSAVHTVLPEAEELGVDNALDNPLMGTPPHSTHPYKVAETAHPEEQPPTHSPAASEEESPLNTAFPNAGFPEDQHEEPGTIRRVKVTRPDRTRLKYLKKL